MMPRTICQKVRIEFFRRSNCKHRITSMDKNNQIVVEKHLPSNGYNFDRDAKFTIIERNEKDMNTKSIIEKKKKKKKKKKKEKRKIDKMFLNMCHLDFNIKYPVLK